VSAAPSIALIESALIAELSGIVGLSVSSYMGQAEDAGQGDAVSFPAAFPLFQGETLDYVDGPNYRREQKWSVIIAAQSYAGTYDPLTRSGKGAYAVLEAVLAQMANWKPAATLTGIERFTPKSVSRVKLNRTEAWYAIEFTVGYDQTFTAQSW
jgi:hypothetical protein